MNIKQAELITGISKRNIRFYEQAKLICPKRNVENDYREYSEEDIYKLKMVRMLRMVDMPLEQIREVLLGNVDLDAAAEKQKSILCQQAKELEIAIQFCEELGKYAKKETLDVDWMLKRMDEPENQRNLFMQWLEDYKKIAKAEHQKTFVFYPDIAVTKAEEFTMALFEYANSKNLNLVITKEGMYPEFTIDGIEYRAERYYKTVQRVPVSVIRCTAVHPEKFEPDISGKKKIVLKMIHYSWALILIVVFALLILGPWENGLKKWQDWVAAAAIVILVVISIYRFYMFHYNEKG